MKRADLKRLLMQHLGMTKAEIQIKSNEELEQIAIENKLLIIGTEEENEEQKKLLEEEEKKRLEEEEKKRLEEEEKKRLEEEEKEKKRLDEEEKKRLEEEEKNNGNEPNNSLNDLEQRIKNAQAVENSNEGGKPLVEKKQKKIGKKESSPESFRLEGYVLLLIVDTVFPFGFALIHNFIEKRFKIQANELVLNSEQFKKVEPLADQAADYLSFNLNPIAGFALVTAFMYGNNLMLIRSAKIENLPDKSEQPTRKKPTKKV